MKNYKNIKKSFLKDKKVRAAYDALEPEFALIASLIEKRLAHGLTQAALAKKIGTQQSAIARLESGTYNPTVSFLHRVADGLDARVTISIS